MFSRSVRGLNSKDLKLAVPDECDAHVCSNLSLSAISSLLTVSCPYFEMRLVHFDPAIEPNRSAPQGVSSAKSYHKQLVLLLEVLFDWPARRFHVRPRFMKLARECFSPPVVLFTHKIKFEYWRLAVRWRRFGSYIDLPKRDSELAVCGLHWPRIIAPCIKQFAYGSDQRQVDVGLFGQRH